MGIGICEMERGEGLRHAATIPHQHAALPSHAHTHRVEVNDLGHGLCGEYDLVKQRHAAAHQPRIAALRQYCQPPAVAVRQDVGHLLRGAGPQHQLTLAAVFVHPVPALTRRQRGHFGRISTAEKSVLNRVVVKSLAAVRVHPVPVLFTKGGDGMVNLR